MTVHHTRRRAGRQLLGMAAAVVLTGSVVSGCAGGSGSGDPDAGGPASRSAKPSASVRSSASGGPRTATPGSGSGVAAPSSRPGNPGGPAEITLAFAGDVHFESQLRQVARDPQGLADLTATTGRADFSMVNLETALTEGGRPLAKNYTFRAPLSALTTLKNAGIDLVSMANNHGIDFGPTGFVDTLAAKRSGAIPIVGVGADEADAFAPHVRTIGGVRTAFFAVSQILEESLTQFPAWGDQPGIASGRPLDRLLRAVRETRPTVDVVVVYLHWGVETATCPDRRSVDTATALEAAGADIIVGAHAHRVQGHGWLGRAYVGYGLGNHVWYVPREPSTYTGVLRLTVDTAAARVPPAERPPGRSVVSAGEWEQLLIRANGIPRPATGGAAARMNAAYEKAMACSGLDHSRPDE